MRRILVTGATGFVGPYLLRELLDSPDETTVVGTRLRGAADQGLPDDLRERVHLVECDLTDGLDIAQTVSAVAPDAVVHLAAQSSVPGSYRDPELTYRVNLDGTRRLYDALLRAENRPRVLFIGSGDVYGPVSPEENPIAENAPFRPVNPYAVSKAAADLLSYQYFRNFGLPIVRLRPFNHIGRGQGPGFVAPDFASQVAAIESGSRKPVIMTGDLSARRDFTDVRDMVRAYAMALEHCEPGEAYNIGSGTSAPVSRVLEILLGLARVPIEHRDDPDRMRPSESPLRQCDPAKFLAATGWEPKHRLDDTLAEVLDDWRKRTPR